MESTRVPDIARQVEAASGDRAQRIASAKKPRRLYKLLASLGLVGPAVSLIGAADTHPVNFILFMVLMTPMMTTALVARAEAEKRCDEI